MKDMRVTLFVLVAILALAASVHLAIKTSTPAEAHSSSIAIINPYDLDANGGIDNEDCHTPSPGLGYQCAYDIGHGSPFHDHTHTVYIRADSQSSTYWRTQVCQDPDDQATELPSNGYRAKFHFWAATGDWSGWQYAGSVSYTHLSGPTAANNVIDCDEGAMSQDATSVSLGTIDTSYQAGCGEPCPHVHLDWWAWNGWHYEDVDTTDGESIDDDAELFHLQW
jgi:hypothetical protein